MNKVAIGCIFYNNHDELKRLLDSIPPKAIDWFIGIDGIFKFIKDQHPELEDLSTDGSRQLIASHGINKVGKFLTCVVNKPNCTEFEKRNCYLETIEKLRDIDVLVIVDSDEFFTYPTIGGPTPIERWNRLKKNIEIEMITNATHNVYGIPYLEAAPGTVDTYKPRIWVNPTKMRYINGSHYNFANIETEKQDIENFNRYKQTYCQHAAKIIRGGVTLAHNHDLRTEEYQERRTEYQRYLVKFESLVQSHKYTQQQAHQIASQQPDNTFKPT